MDTKTTETETQAFGQRVRISRELSGVSLRDLAKKANISASQISQIERGNSEPSLDYALRIANALNMPLSALIWEMPRDKEMLTGDEWILLEAYRNGNFSSVLKLIAICLDEEV